MEKNSSWVKRKGFTGEEERRRKKRPGEGTFPKIEKKNNKTKRVLKDRSESRGGGRSSRNLYSIKKNGSPLIKKKEGTD